MTINIKNALILLFLLYALTGCTIPYDDEDRKKSMLPYKEMKIETPAVKVIPKIKSLIRHPEVSMVDLTEDEVSLAVLAQISDELTVKNVNKAALFTARLSSEETANPQSKETRH